MKEQLERFYYGMRYGFWSFRQNFDWWLLYMQLKGFPKRISETFWEDLSDGIDFK